MPYKFENILLVELTLLSKRQIWDEDFFSNVVVFSQYLNFNLKLLSSNTSNNNFTNHDNHFDIILTLDTYDVLPNAHSRAKIDVRPSILIASWIKYKCRKTIVTLSIYLQRGLGEPSFS